MTRQIEANNYNQDRRSHIVTKHKKSDGLSRISAVLLRDVEEDGLASEQLTTFVRSGLASMVRTLFVPNLVACIQACSRRSLLTRNAMARHANPRPEPRLVLPLVPLF